ncbi:aa3-type cytochrome c oxidase subunit IV [Limimaricola hongkongensis]|uniref:aa3-type cytochrome c oxidase subunit IV n=1 Tax=Limimaricola hongkongensis TaxID=278132 RepID=UPI00039ABF7D
MDSVYFTARYASFEDHQMADDQHNHVHGSMDITDQERTFDGFMKLVTRGTIAIIVALILLALVNA